MKQSRASFHFLFKNILGGRPVRAVGGQKAPRRDLPEAVRSDLPALVNPEPLVQMLAHMGLKMVVQGLRHLFCGCMRDRRVDQNVEIEAVLAPRRIAWDQQRVIFQREFRGRERGLGRMGKFWRV